MNGNEKKITIGDLVDMVKAYTFNAIESIVIAVTPDKILLVTDFANQKGIEQYKCKEVKSFGVRVYDGYNSNNYDPYELELRIYI